MCEMSRLILILFAATVVGCTGSVGLENQYHAESEYYVSCAPHIFYCYRKSDLICYRGYRVITVDSREENPGMIIKCH
ncbi:MAG: hypothetical protein MAG581_00482 [Deltaproteobacteria bacterium]|jgi:hypothetical protein|nr:hypothetical protein [Deltaproteobacteria bacterium]